MLFNGDCLEVMKTLEDKSIDLVFCDLPYGQTSCKWDCKIDLVEFWKQIMRIKKLNTPLFFTTTTKFGVELINSAPKKCFFRYDLVWVKSAPAGFLTAKKMPMRKHEMVYVFYEKLPFYDLSRHTHKFIKKEVVKKVKRDSTYGKIETHDLKTGKNNGVARYDPPLPVSVVKEEEKQDNNKDFSVEVKNSTYGTLQIKQPITSGARWEPPLPVSVVKEEEDLYHNGNRKGGFGGENKGLGAVYQDPTLISSQDVHKKNGLKSQGYDPPLPVSIVKEGDITIAELEPEPEPELNSQSNARHGAKQAEGDDSCYQDPTLVRGMDYAESVGEKGIRKYDPPLPNTLLEIKSTRGKHSTEKPVALMEWVLSYYSKEGDIILDPTMGSGSTGVACKNLNRKFIGIEMDADIFEVAKSRNPDELIKG